MAKKQAQHTYAESIERLEAIVKQIDSNELDIDQLSETIKEAKELIAFCTEKLNKTDTEIEKLLSENKKSE